MASSTTAAAASDDVPPLPKYDVFLSFRGVDTRIKFTSHLRAGLERKNISTYMDDKSLERGEEIGPALLKAIEQSKISIIIFSEHYASSPWCLDELVHILKCKEIYGQLVIPVFYDIDPPQVRWQQATYKDSFEKYNERFKDNMEKVHAWKNALTTAASLSGVHSKAQNIRDENELVETIVKDIWTKLNRNTSYTVKGLVGMENHIQQIEFLCAIQTQEVGIRAIGICGMGGIGKTTLADAVFHRNSRHFHACLFLANVREETEKHGPIHLRNELLRKLLKEENLSIGSPSIGSSFVKERLSRTKVLVVLDDVSDMSQLEFLLNDQIQFGHGSRIIITSRDKSLLMRHGVHVDNIYEVTLLPVDDAVKLFQTIAFKNGSSTSTEDYSSLSTKVVEYAGRLPLALKVLAASFFRCKNRKDWEEELAKLKKYPNNSTIDEVLIVSYKLLEKHEKEIFLDIACFFKGEKVDDVKRMLEMHGFCASGRGIQVLADMFLISIIHNRIEMHDLLQNLGIKIDRDVEEPEKRKRLWNEDAYRALNTQTGTSQVEVMFLDMSKIEELQLSPTVFKNMLNLKLLKFYVPQEVREELQRQTEWSVEKRPGSLSWLSGFKQVQYFLAKSRLGGLLRLLDLYPKVGNYDDELFQKYCRVYLPGGLESLPKELRYLYWDGYPLKSLPSKYSPENLVELHLPHSQLKQLWSNGQNLWSLKHVNLSHSTHLTEVPDLSGSPNIENVDLSDCTSLVEIPPYFQDLEKLISLDLKGCWNLTIFWEIPCNLEVLNLNGSGIEEISPSIWSHEKLYRLDLGYCFNLKNLPSSSIYKVGDPCQVGIEHLVLRCSVIENMPEGIYNLNCLQSLDLFGCENLKRWPPLLLGCFSSLRDLNLSCCSVLEIPDSLICLPSLQDIDLSRTMIERIPSSIINCSELRSLRLWNCKRLRDIPELPWQLEILEADGCTSLQNVASSRSAIMQNWQHYKSTDYRGEKLEFSNCSAFNESARRNIVSDSQLRLMRMASLRSSWEHPGRTSTVNFPGNEIPGWFRYQSEGCSISITFPAGTTLDHNCLAGFALSVVVAKSECALPSEDRLHYNPCLYLVACEFNFKTNNDNDGEGYQGRVVSSPVWGGKFGSYAEEDHVLVFLEKDMYWRQRHTPESSSNPDHFDEVTQASFLFYPGNYKNGDLCEERRLKVNKCGVHILYRSDCPFLLFGNDTIRPIPPLVRFCTKSFVS